MKLASPARRRAPGVTQSSKLESEVGRRTNRWASTPPKGKRRPNGPSSVLSMTVSPVKTPINSRSPDPLSRTKTPPPDAPAKFRSREAPNQAWPRSDSSGGSTTRVVTTGAGTLGSTTRSSKYRAAYPTRWITVPGEGCRNLRIDEVRCGQRVAARQQLQVLFGRVPGEGSQVGSSARGRTRAGCGRFRVITWSRAQSPCGASSSPSAMT